MSKRLATLETLIDKGSNDPFVHYARALEHRSLGDLPTALRFLTEVGERFPSYVPTYLMAAQVAAELGETATAKTWAERGIAAAAADPHARSELEALLAGL